MDTSRTNGYSPVCSVMHCWTIWAMAILVFGLPLATAQKTPAAPPAPDVTAPSRPIAVIDGRQTPHLIPDVASYILLFRMLADRPGGKSVTVRADALMPAGLTAEQSNAVIDTANQFEVLTSSLDGTVRGIKDRSWPRPDAEAIAALQLLDRKREVIVRQLLTDLRIALGDDASRRLSAHMEMNFKPTMKGVYVELPKDPHANHQ